MNMSSRRILLPWPALVPGLLAIAICTRSFAVQDVMLQTVDGKIVTGVIDDGTGIGALGTRVFRGNFFTSNFITADPGFFGLTTGSPSMPAGASGFPSNHDIEFDLLPMKIEAVTSNLLYWDGTDLGGDGFDLSDVAFASSPGVSWKIVDDVSNSFIASGTDAFIPGGRIDRTSADTDPSDGVDTGRVHAHLALQLIASGTPPEGIYVIAWQARSVGFDTSDPFLFVHRTSTISDSVRNLAADWTVANIDSMFGPALPGDYNEDHVVDAADFTVWRDALGMEIALPNEDASPNVVDAEDYIVWKANFGQSVGGGAGAVASVSVPEPSIAASLGAILLLSLATGRQKRARRGPGLAPRRC